MICHSRGALASLREIRPGFWSLVRTLVCILLIASGCSTKPKTIQLSGKVIFKGDPVPAGYIAFTPDVVNGGRGSVKVLQIKDGVYDSSKEPPDQALTPGPYFLRIAGFDGKPI